MGKAKVFIDTGSYTSALEVYEKIINLDPNNASAFKTRDALLDIVEQPKYNTSNIEDATKIYKECVDSAVFVLTNKSTGSGVIVKEDGTFITCYHVIEGATSIFVKTNNGRVYRIKGYKYLNKEQDIAILTLDTNDTFKPIQFPTHQSLEIGSKVYTISNPKGVQFTFSDGMLSQEYQGLLQFTAPVSPGSSGGALLDAHGHLIGIIKSQVREGQNINFATSNEVYYRMLNNPVIPYNYSKDYSELTPNYYNNTTGTNPYQSSNACSYQKLQFLQSQYDALKKELEEIVQNENYRQNVNLMGDARAAIFGTPKIRDVQPSRYESQRKLELEQQMRYYQQQIDHCLKGSSF
jgi:tetratricopeptide (TPR) repeat protein